MLTFSALPLAALALLSLPILAAEPASYSVFRSHDNGRTWSPSSSGLPSGSRINALAVVRDTVIAATDAGIFLSTDRGASWTLAAGSQTRVGRALSLVTLGATVFAGTDRNGILRSSDAGARWRPASNVPLRRVRALIAHGGALYAGTDAQGVFVTHDGGQSWLPLSEGLPPQSQVFSLSAVGGSVFAGLYSKGLYALRGGAWHRVGSVTPLALAASGPALLAGHNPGGIFRSDDHGATWNYAQIAPSAGLDNAPVWELAASSTLALAGISQGVYLSTDQGRTWSRALTGLPPHASGIAFLITPSFILAATAVRR